MRIARDLTGKGFNRLTVIRRTARKDQAYWECRCDCGNIVIVRGTHLTSQHTQSCGCLHYELFAKAPKYSRNKFMISKLMK